MGKEELRAVYKQIRLRMSKSEASSKSRMIGRRLINGVDWSAYQKICVFEPIDKLNEVQINGVVSRLKAQGLEIVTAGRTRDTVAPSGTFDLILVPCLAFDEARYRLGWGGGWYDKFLAAQPQALKIGLAYQNGLISGRLPRQAHDIKLDKIFTETQVY